MPGGSFFRVRIVPRRFRRWDPELRDWLLADNAANRRALLEHFGERLDSPAARIETASHDAGPESNPAVALLARMRERMLLHGFSTKTRK
jgi:hypothetical protein